MAYLTRSARPPVGSKSGVAGLLLLAAALLAQLSQCIKFSVGIEHDLSGPTYGLEGKSGSQLNYDERNGLKLGGTLADLLGPPIKIANGLGNLFHGANMAGMGSGLRGGGALLGFDAKMLEAAGASHLLRGGVKWQGLESKNQPGEQVAGTKGRKIGSVIEVPIRVVAMKELAAGNALQGAGQLKAAQAHAVDSKGQTLQAQGQALKAQGLNQIVQGASEGVHNLGNLLHKTSGNVNSAVKLLPLVWDMQVQEAQEAQQEAKGRQQQQQQQQQQQLLSTPQHLGVSQASSLSGGSLFGGLSSLMPGMMLGGQHATPGYAAMWNSTHPLTSLLMSPHSNPFFMPLASGPLGQALQAKQMPGLDNTQSATYNFNLLPGLKYSEHISSSAPTLKKKLMLPSKLANEQPIQQVEQQVEQQIMQQPQQQAKP